MLVVFEKGVLLRHIGHLDLMRAMQRALRRSGLPIAYSQGFNPHMVMNFASPLPVGMAGLREIMDVALAREMEEAAFLSKLKGALPPALKAVAVRTVGDSHPAPMALLYAAAYEIHIPGPAGEAMVRAIPEFLAQTSVPAMRKTKSGEKPCDLRPMIYELGARAAEDGSLINATLALREEAAAKPELLMTALSQFCGIQEIPAFSAIRTSLLGQGPDGLPAPLESV